MVRQLCRHVSWKIPVHVDGGLSRGSHVRRPISEAPHRRKRKFPKVFLWSKNYFDQISFKVQNYFRVEKYFGLKFFCGIENIFGIESFLLG